MTLQEIVRSIKKIEAKGSMDDWTRGELEALREQIMEDVFFGSARVFNRDSHGRFLPNEETKKHAPLG
jgi:hypothetical protein